VHYPPKTQLLFYTPAAAAKPFFLKPGNIGVSCSSDLGPVSKALRKVANEIPFPQARSAHAAPLPLPLQMQEQA
jgi:hypothetical protein